MSPERLRGKSLTTSTDIYALAMTYFELFTGEVPFGYIDESEVYDSKRYSTTTPVCEDRSRSIDTTS